MAASAQFMLLGYTVAIDKVQYRKTRPDIGIPIEILRSDNEKSVTFGPYSAEETDPTNVVVLPDPAKCKVMCALIVDLTTKEVLATITQENASTMRTPDSTLFSAPFINAPDVTAHIRMTVRR